MIFKWYYAVIAGLLAALASVDADTAVQQTRSSLEKWVEARQLISKTRTDWQSDKEMLQQTIELFEREIKLVEDQLSKISTNNVQVDKERLEAESQKNKAVESLEQTKSFAAAMEGKIRSLVPQFPPPLQDALKPLLNRMPMEKDTRASAAERMQVIVGVLNEIDKFSGSISVFSERRKNDKSEDVAVETVYVGLGAAYFVNEAGDFAGTGVFRDGAWKWATVPSLASDVREAIRIYRNERPARFVSLPAQIQ